LGLGVGINQFYYQICRKYLNIKRKETTLFLKRQGDYQIGLQYHDQVDKPIYASTSNERWGVDNINMERYIEFGKKKYNSILTIVDYYSKKVWTVAVKESGSANGKALEYICNLTQTFPHIIQCDNGASFKGDFETSINDINRNRPPNQQIKLVHTTTYNPTANGLVERMNREIRKKIQAGFISHNNLL